MEQNKNRTQTSGIPNTKTLESWFKRNPQNPSSSRWTPEIDVRESDENQLKMYERKINSMDKNELDKKFEKLLVDLFLPEHKKRMLRSYPDENKKNMLIMQYRGATQVKDKSDTPQQYVNYLKSCSKFDNLNPFEIYNCVQSLRVSLTNNSLSWIREFGMEGLQAVVGVLDLATKRNADDTFEKIQLECIKCVLKVISVTGDSKEFYSDERSREIVANCIDFSKPTVMILALQLDLLFQRIPKEDNTVSQQGKPTLSHSTLATDFEHPDDYLLKTYEETINSLDKDDLDKKFEELLNSIALTENIKQLVRSYPQENKTKMLIMYYKGSNQIKKNKFNTPQQYITYLQNCSKSVTLNPSEIYKCVEALRMSLTNNTLSWIREFGIKGLEAVLDILDLATKRNAVDTFEKIQLECIKCVLKFVSVTKDSKEFFSDDHSHEIVANCIDFRKPTVMILALQVLAALCFLSDNTSGISGSEKILSAITKLGQMRKCERFLPIIEGITMTSNNELWSMCLQFINTLLSEVDGFELRNQLKTEILHSGLNVKLDCLRNESIPLIKEQYKRFEDMQY